MRYLKFFAAFGIVFMLLSCCPTRRAANTSGTMEGIIYSIGNEPFTKLGIQASDSTMYILNCPKEIESSLNSMQGKKVKVKYDKLEQTPEGKILRVTKAE